MPVQAFQDFMPPRWVPPVKPKPRDISDEEVADRLDRIYRVK